MQLYNKIKIHETQIVVKAKNKQFLKVSLIAFSSVCNTYLFHKHKIRELHRASILTLHSSGVPFLRISATLHNCMHTQL